MAEWSGIGGKRVVITGATNGIGLAAAQALARRGAKLSIVARSPTKAEDAVARIRQAGGDDEVDVLLADLASLEEVRRLAAEIRRRYPSVEVLVNNAGAMHTARQTTVDGLELTWAVNHVAPFLLTTLLLERLAASAPARVITTSSAAHSGVNGIPFDDLGGERVYARRSVAGAGYARYSESKLANVLFTAELARRTAGTGVSAFCFHPGFVASGFNRNNGPRMSAGMVLLRPFTRSPAKGADTLVWLADSPEAAAFNGAYFTDRRPRNPSAAAQDAEAARRLWEVTEEQARASSSAG